MKTIVEKIEFIMAHSWATPYSRERLQPTLHLAKYPASKDLVQRFSHLNLVEGEPVWLLQTEGNAQEAYFAASRSFEEGLDQLVDAVVERMKKLYAQAGERNTATLKELWAHEEVLKKALEFAQGVKNG